MEGGGSLWPYGTVWGSTSTSLPSFTPNGVYQIKWKEELAESAVEQVERAEYLDKDQKDS